MRPNSKCRITFEELLDLQDGRVSPAETERLRAHLATGCASCEERLAEIARLHSVLRSGELESAPEHVRLRAKEIFRERFVRPAHRSLLARLVSDSRAQLALSGARGAESGQIQALYSTEEHDVDLWQEKGEDGNWYIIGQVMPRDGGAPIQPADASLRSAAGADWQSRPEGSEFHLDGVPAGRYSLRIMLPDAEITADDFEIGLG